MTPVEIRTALRAAWAEFDAKIADMVDQLKDAAQAALHADTQDPLGDLERFIENKAARSSDHGKANVITHALWDVIDEIRRMREGGTER